MKKEYKKPCLKLSNIDLSSLCQVIGNVSGGSGTGEGEEDMSSKKRNHFEDESWGNLW